MNDFELLTILDSPLIDVMAPELIDLRTRVRTAMKPVPGGCTPCQERERFSTLLRLQIELADLLQSNPTLESLTAQLLASAKQVYNGR